MKTKFVATLLLVYSLVIFAADALAARRITTVHGILGTSSPGESVLKTSGDKGYYFDSTSAAGSKILSTCRTGKDCIVRGVINGNKILNAYYIKVGK
jgi:hypothetical protein